MLGHRLVRAHGTHAEPEAVFDADDLDLVSGRELAVLGFRLPELAVYEDEAASPRLTAGADDVLDADFDRLVPDLDDLQDEEARHHADRPADTEHEWNRDVV